MKTLGETMNEPRGAPQDEPRSALPANGAARKRVPLARGVLDYFPAALAAVAEVSVAGNEKHNPGEELHHSRAKSADHADCILRHLVDRGSVDPDTGLRHSAEMAWRALALLQEELEGAGLAPLARGARGVVEESSSLRNRNFRVAGGPPVKRIAKLFDYDDDAREA